MEVDMVARHGGGFVAGWTSWGVDGSSFGLVGRVFDGDMTPITDEFPINDYAHEEQGHAAIALFSGRACHGRVFLERAGHI
jgi:hypothetical protein